MLSHVAPFSSDPFPISPFVRGISVSSAWFLEDEAGGPFAWETFGIEHHGSSSVPVTKIFRKEKNKKEENRPRVGFQF